MGLPVLSTLANVKMAFRPLRKPEIAAAYRRAPRRNMENWADQLVRFMLFPLSSLARTNMARSPATPHEPGAIPVHIVPEQIRHAPTVNAVTRSGYLHVYRNNEVPNSAPWRTFARFEIGPDRDEEQHSQLYEYPISMDRQPDRFRYDERTDREQVQRQLTPMSGPTFSQWGRETIRGR